MMRLKGKIIDDMRFIRKEKSDSRRNARWLCECIFCYKRKIMATPNIKNRVGTHCSVCSNKRGAVLKDDEQGVIYAYKQGVSIKLIAYNISISPQTIYKILHRNDVQLRRNND